jgi:hypothetical protein
MSNRCLAAALAAALSVALAGCITLPSVSSDERAVQPASDPSKVVEFINPVVWLDRPEPFATRGVRLMPGRYELEAENEDYRYFRAPSPIEMRILDGGKIVDGRDIPGGLALAKSAFNVVPAAAYVDVGLESARMHVMKLDQVFMALEGEEWKKSFTD